MEVFWVLLVFLSHCRVLEDLQLVELDRGEGQARNDVGGFEHHRFGFAGQAEDEVRPARNVVLRGQVDGAFRRREIVAAIDAP